MGGDMEETRLGGMNVKWQNDTQIDRSKHRVGVGIGIGVR
jgi:hypothetical protein